MEPSAAGTRQQVGFCTADHALHRIIPEIAPDRSVRLRKERISPIARSPRARDVDFSGENLIRKPGSPGFVVPGVSFLREIPDALTPGERHGDRQNN